MEGEKPKKRDGAPKDIVARPRIWDPGHGGCGQKAGLAGFPEEGLVILRETIC